MAIACMVLGIVSCALGWIPFFSIVTLACGIVAIVLATKVNKQLKAQGLKDNKVTAGLVTGIIGTCWSGIWTIVSFAGIAACGALNYWR